jgi:hypothetical protein
MVMKVSAEAGADSIAMPATAAAATPSLRMNILILPLLSSGRSAGSPWFGPRATCPTGGTKPAAGTPRWSGTAHRRRWPRASGPKTDRPRSRSFRRKAHPNSSKIESSREPAARARLGVATPPPPSCDRETLTRRAPSEGVAPLWVSAIDTRSGPALFVLARLLFSRPVVAPGRHPCSAAPCPLRWREKFRASCGSFAARSRVPKNYAPRRWERQPRGPARLRRAPPQRFS